MENLDIIILTILVVVSFVIFISTSVKEFSRMEEKPYKFEKASGFTRAALFNMLSSLFTEEDISEQTKNRIQKNLRRTISDMETDGVYFNNKTDRRPKKNKKKND
ncbi:hypothetical protein [Algoriphagus sp.]|uniref:hypothetical protein n=1 Tax=Algoriphagus sp. TaxID=1872435 RepID=UPI00391D2880